MIINTRQGENGGSESEIDLLALLKLLWSRKLILIISALVLAASGYLFARLCLTPTYRTNFTAFVNNRSDSTSDVSTIANADLSASMNLTYTYAEIIKSDPVLEKAAELINLEADIEKLRGYVSTKTGTNTQLVYVYVTMTSPSIAAQYANSVASVSQDYMSDIVEGSSMKIVTSAKVPKVRFFPSYTRYAAIGGLIGLVASAAVVILMDFLDRRVKSEDDLSNLYDIPVIGSIPSMHDFGNKGGKKYGYGYDYGYGEEDKKAASDKTERKDGK